MDGERRQWLGAPGGRRKKGEGTLAEGGEQEGGGEIVAKRLRDGAGGQGLGRRSGEGPPAPFKEGWQDLAPGRAMEIRGLCGV